MAQVSKENNKGTRDLTSSTDLNKKKERYEEMGIRVDLLRICNGLPMTTSN